MSKLNVLSFGENHFVFFKSVFIKLCCKSFNVFLPSTYQLTLISVNSPRNAHFISKDSRMNQIKFFKGCLPQLLLGPFYFVHFTLRYMSNNSVISREILIPKNGRIFRKFCYLTLDELGCK